MTRFPIRIAILITTLLMAFSTTAAAVDLGGHDRDGTVIGLTMGWGWNSIEYTEESGISQDTGTIDTFSGGFRVGWASSDKFIGSIGMYGWKRSFRSWTTISVKNYAFMAEGYYFPLGEGFWVKGGLGLGTVDFFAQAALPTDSVIFNETGWSWSTGTGYEFRISDGAGVGLSYDLLFIPVGDFSSLADVSSLNQSVSINIHFYM
ncbi:MAG: outer membrane beta-barrel protein [Candidatus Krumholzibacteriota bacterium]